MTDSLYGYSGDIVSEFDLKPLLYKRLRIQGSTLRSRSDDYQADLISRCVPLVCVSREICDKYNTFIRSRFQKDILHEITGSNGDGKVRTYIHTVLPWDKVQEAHRTMEADANA